METGSSQNSQEISPALGIFASVVIACVAFLLIDSGIREVIKLGSQLIFKLGTWEEISLLNVILIPVGIGLIKRRSQSRGCAAFLAALVCVAILVGTSIYLFQDRIPENISFSWGSLVLAILAISASAICFWVLTRNADYFNNPGFGSLDDRRNSVIIWSIVCISIISNLYYVSERNRFEQELSSVFPVSVSIYAYDQETRLPIDKSNRIGMEYPRTLSSDTDYEDQVSSSFSTKELDDQTKVMYVQLRGLAFGSYRVWLTADGYVKKEVVIDRDSDSNLQVYLEKVVTP